MMRAPGGRGRAAGSARRRVARSRPGGARQSDRVRRCRPAREPGAGGGGGRAALRGSGCARDCSRHRGIHDARSGRPGSIAPATSKSHGSRPRRVTSPPSRRATLTLAISADVPRAADRARRRRGDARAPRRAEPVAVPEVQPHVRRRARSPSSRAGTPTENGSRAKRSRSRAGPATPRACRPSAWCSTRCCASRVGSAELEDPTRRMVDAQPARDVMALGARARCSPTRTSSTKRRSRSKPSPRDGFATVADDVLRTFTLCGTAEVTAILRDAALGGAVVRDARAGRAVVRRFSAQRLSRRRRPLSRTARNDARPSRRRDRAPRGRARDARHMRAAPWVARTPIRLGGRARRARGASSIASVRSGS